LVERRTSNSKSNSNDNNKSKNKSNSNDNNKSKNKSNSKNNGNGKSWLGKFVHSHLRRIKPRRRWGTQACCGWVSKDDGND